MFWVRGSAGMYVRCFRSEVTHQAHCYSLETETCSWHEGQNALMLVCFFQLSVCWLTKVACCLLQTSPYLQDWSTSVKLFMAVTVWLEVFFLFKENYKHSLSHWCFAWQQLFKCLFFPLSILEAFISIILHYLNL